MNESLVETPINVKERDTVKVDCATRHINLGEITLTCTDTGTFDGQPDCTKIGESFQYYIDLDNVFTQIVYL